MSPCRHFAASDWSGVLRDFARWLKNVCLKRRPESFAESKSCPQFIRDARVGIALTFRVPH
jgi:hypothetical protein